MSAEDVLVVLVTGPDRQTLEELGRAVVTERLAACANVLEGVRSIYRWKEEVEEDSEALAIIKTTRARVEELEDRVRSLHPYEEPEFLAIDVAAGSRSYMDWVIDSVAAGH